MGDGGSDRDHSDFQVLAISMGRVLNNSLLYGPEHSVSAQSIESCYNTLTLILDKHDEIELHVGDDELAINGVQIELKNPLARMLVSRLSKLDVSDLSLFRGMDQDKFKKFMEVLLSSPEDIQESGGFTALLASSRLDHIKARHVRYQEVDEDEVVVERKGLEQPREGGGEEKAEEAENIVAFLKGGQAGKNVREALKERVDDAERLTAFILEAAGLNSPDGISSVEPFSDIVVESMRRAYKTLSEGDATSTKKGRKQLRKTLRLIEKQILERLEKEGSIGDAEREEISGAVEEMVDELEIDTLAIDYMKKRKAIEENEKRILRFIKAKGEEIDDTELYEKLEAGGLNEKEWKELVARSGVGAAYADAGEGGTSPRAEGGAQGGPQGFAFGAVGQLAVLLTDLQRVLQEASNDGTPQEEILAKVNETVRGMAEQTAEKIGKLLQTASEDASAEEAAAKEGKPPPEPKLTKKDLLVVLGEIGQELCQPLAVISCSLQMLIAGSLGDVSQSQRQSLDLASDSADKLQKLANKMMSISGTPETLSPDAKIQESLYE